MSPPNTHLLGGGKEGDLWWGAMAEPLSKEVAFFSVHTYGMCVYVHIMEKTTLKLDQEGCPQAAKGERK